MKPASTTRNARRNDFKRISARKLTLVFASGCLGGMTNSITVWLFGAAGVTALFGVAIAPSLTSAWLYPRIIWGGIWGLLFLLPFSRSSYFRSGILYSLFPTLAQLFIVFPLQAHKGVMGAELGYLTPVFVLFFNAVWGMSAGLWLKFIFSSRPKVP